MNTYSPASAYSLDHVSDDELHLSARRLVGRSNQLLAALLAHLGEVEARGIHRERSCASLYAYCVYELRLSEDAAFRRARAAKLAREFPIVLDQIAAGELHLTGLLLLGPHLTEDNHRELLALARHRTKRDILRLIRRIDPKPDTPASVEPLGPVPVGMPMPEESPSWEAFVESLCPPVRQLSPGESPREWTTGHAPDDDSDLPVQAPTPAGAPPEATRASAERGEPSGADQNRASEGIERPAAAPRERNRASAGAESARAPERYKVQFTASQEYVDLLEQAKDLMSHALPSGALAELHLQAMRLLVADLKKRRCALPSRSRTTKKPLQRGETELPRQRGEAEAPRQCGASHRPPERGEGDTLQKSNCPPSAPRQREHVAAAVRRTVWSRDGSRCSYVDIRGVRCAETSLLELHHLDPHALGGPNTSENLTLRCRAHNALAAEQEFGRDFMQEKREGRGQRTRGVPGG